MFNDDLKNYTIIINDFKLPVELMIRKLFKSLPKYGFNYRTNADLHEYLRNAKKQIEKLEEIAKELPHKPLNDEQVNDAIEASTDLGNYSLMMLYSLLRAKFEG